MKNDWDNLKVSRYEITLRALGEALEALAVDSFELILDGDSFIVHGGSDNARPSAGTSPN